MNYATYQAISRLPEVPFEYIRIAANSFCTDKWGYS